MIKLAESKADIAKCYSVMKQLRTHLVEKHFVELVESLMDDNYQLAYIEKNNEVVCVAGFKISTNLFLGKNIYVEDLVTDANQRSSGFGGQMMGWIRELALKEGCSAVHLDSGVQRHAAHKFYLNQNMDIVCYHFVERLAKPGS